MFRLAKKRGGASYKIPNPLEPKKNVTALFDTESAANQFIMTEGLKGYKPEEVKILKIEEIIAPSSQLDKGAA